MDSKKEYKRLWYLKNREKEITKAALYRKTNPDVKKNWLKENGNKPKVRFDKAKSNATLKREKEWNLTFEEYKDLISKPCTYCEKDISQEKGCGLDRLDNNMGYNINNVVPCCKACNSARNTHFTAEEWLIGVKAILEFRKNKGV